MPSQASDARYAGAEKSRCADLRTSCAKIVSPLAGPVAPKTTI
jgi:hypothetical protein